MPRTLLSKDLGGRPKAATQIYTLYNWYYLTVIFCLKVSVLSFTRIIEMSFAKMSPFLSNLSAVPTTDLVAEMLTVFIFSKMSLRVPFEREIASRIT